MDSIQDCVAAARRRLLLRQWAGRSAVCLAWAFSLALIGILAAKLIAIEGLPPWWSAAWLGSALVLGLATATIGTFARPRTPLEAAIAIDQRYDLRERVASSLQLDETTLATEAGAALARDTERALGKVEVNERFTLGLDRRVWLPIAPALLGLLATLLPNATAEATIEKPDATQLAAEELKKAADESRQKLKKRREQAEKDGLTDATALLKKVEEGTGELAKKEPKDKTEAAVKLNDLTKQLAERKQKLGGGDALRDQLNRMKDLGRGPAEKAADAMKSGDWKKALGELEKLRKDLADGKVSPEKQQQLAKQLGKMQERLATAAQKQEDLKQELQRQLAEAQRKGDLNQAGKLQQKLDQLAQKKPQMQRMQQMAKQMQKAQQCMQNGDCDQAAEAMQQMAKMMQQMQREDQELKMLDGAMTDIQMAKQAMGMEAQKLAQMAQGMGMGQGMGKDKDGPPGEGMGESRGKGARPSEENDVNFRDTKVKQNVGRGASTFGGLVKGPSIKGDVAESIKTQLTADNIEPADPLTSERLPRSKREHAEEFFRAMREKL